MKISSLPSNRSLRVTSAKKDETLQPPVNGVSALPTETNPFKCRLNTVSPVVRKRRRPKVS